MPDKTSPSTSDIIILAAGAVALLASFLEFAGDRSAWGSGAFPIVTLIPLYMILMAVPVALTRFAGVNLPERILTLSWDQLHLALGFFAALMAICWLIALDDHGIGQWLLLVASFAAVAGAYMRPQEHRAGTIG